MRNKIAPSVLSADFARLGEQVKEIEAAGADQIHVDVMDGHFVPNLSMGPVVVEALRRTTRLPLDVHLMISDPAKYIDPFIKAGASHISFHIEVAPDPVALARRLRERGVGAGLVLNPGTPVERVLDFLPDFDLILVMTVNPGFSGQGFLGENLEKVRAIRRRERENAGGNRPRSALDVQVDGGIDTTTAPLARDAGANVFVAASAIFGQKSPGRALQALRASIDAVGAGV